MSVTLEKVVPGPVRESVSCSYPINSSLADGPSAQYIRSATSNTCTTRNDSFVFSCLVFECQVYNQFFVLSPKFKVRT